MNNIITSSIWFRVFFCMCSRTAVSKLDSSVKADNPCAFVWITVSFINLSFILQKAMENLYYFYFGKAKAMEKVMIICIGQSNRKSNHCIVWSNEHDTAWFDLPSDPRKFGTTIDPSLTWPAVESTCIFFVTSSETVYRMTYTKSSYDINIRVQLLQIDNSS